MNLKQVKPNAVALLVAGALLLVVGSYTGNGGFQLAGGMTLVVALILALNQANHRPGE